MHRFASLIASLPLVLVPVAASAGVVTAIEEDRREGRIDDHDARMQTFAALFAPEALRPEYAGLPSDDAPRCATTLLSDLKLHWAELTPEERHLVDSATNPFYRAAVEAGEGSWLDGDGARATCFGVDAWQQSGTYDHYYETENFGLHYNLRSPVTQLKVENLADYFEESLVVEHEEMGFYLPANMTTFQMLVIVERLASPGVGGFTSQALCGGGGFMAFIVVNESWFDSDEHLRSVAAHEFFHGVQHQYGLEEFWLNESPNRWWIEASAVFMETEVYPTLYNSQANQAFRWFWEPHRSLLTHDNTGFQYGTYLFPATAREGLGESDWFLELWQQIEGRSGYDLVAEIDELFQTRGSSFLEQYGNFVRQGATGSFDFNPYLSLEEGYFEVTTVFDEDVDDYPVYREVNAESGADRPEYLGSNYVRLDGDGVPDDQALWITFTGDAEKNGDPVEWIVRLVAIEDDEPKATWDLPLEANTWEGEAFEYFGQALLNDFGEDFDAVYIGASPVLDFGEGGVSWTYTAHLIDTRGDGGFIDVPADLLADGDGDGEGCAGGCAAGGANPGGALGLLLLLGFARGRVRG